MSGVWVWHPAGEWEFLGDRTEHGTWNAGSSKCTFPAFAQGYGLSQGLGPGIPVYGPNDPLSHGHDHMTLRVASQSVINRGRAGLVSVPISASAQYL